jgi:hypothetical protein
VKLAFGIQRKWAALVILCEVLACAVAVDGSGTRINIATDTGFLGKSRQAHPALKIYRSGQIGVNFGRCIVAQASEINHRINAM